MQLPAELQYQGDGSEGVKPPEDYPAMAIIGIGCRLPGDVTSAAQLWDLLAQERCAAGPVPSTRFNGNAYSGGKDEPATSVGAGGYFLNNDVRQFDNQFFGINNREAADMDPQQRNLLEVIFECFESAGYSLNQVSGAQVGCYIGSWGLDHASLLTKDIECMTRYSGTGMGIAILANRVSHAFNLKGPSSVIDTACSASMYALHQAISGLKNRECDSAVVAGVNIIQSPDVNVGASKLGVLSPSSTCHTFDESADGYGRAEGVSAVYIKRLEDAIRDCDPIRSIIRGTAVNSNGRTPGITQPSIDGQIAVGRMTYAQAGLDPSDTGYVEMHGTGTAVGDVMEAQSVAAVFSQASRQYPILVGGIKPNIGHSEAASGLSSVIKATLALERKELPPTIGVVNLNQKLQLEKHGMQLVEKPTPFPKLRSGVPRRISVNCFGYGGANTHGIFEEAGPLARFTASCLRNSSSDDALDGFDCARTYLLPLSANDGHSLERRVDQLAQLDFRADIIADLAYTLSERRSHLKTRGFVIARPETLSSDLSVDNLRLASSTGQALTVSHKFLFAFTGQGAQWQGMAEDLLQVPVFANAISQMDEALASLPHPPSWKISTTLKLKPEVSPINEAGFAQPVTTAVQIGLVETLRALRIPTDGVVGHSSGEIAAAYAANMLDMREAITLAYYRGYAVTQCAPVGAMAAVGLASDEAEEWIRRTQAAKSQVQVACINSPKNVTISGDSGGIDALVLSLTAEGIFARKLKTDGKAYHSHQMEIVSHTYEALLKLANLFPTYESLLQRANLSPSTPLPEKSSSGTDPSFFSTVIKKQVARSEIRTTAYWRRNLESPVHFLDGLRGLCASFENFCLVEVGPHTALKMPILQALGQSSHYFGTLKRGKSSLTCLLELVGGLFTAGYPVSFPHLQQLYPSPTSSLKVLHDLPPYPWHYEELLWNESRISRESRERKFPRHELLGSPISGGNLITLGWRNRLLLDNVPWLRDHKLGDLNVFPATAYLSMAVEALLQARGIEMTRDLTEFSVVFQHVELPYALAISDQEAVELYTELSPREISSLSTFRHWCDFKIVSVVGDASTIRARGTIRLQTGSVSLNENCLPQTHYRLVPKGRRIWYENMYKCGLHYGNSFQHMQDILTPDMKGVLYAQAKLENLQSRFEAAQPSPRYLLHPAILDSILQASLIACAGGDLESMVAKVPKAFGRIVLKAPSCAEKEATIHSASSVIGFATNEIHATLLDSNQHCLSHFESMKFIKYSGNDKMEEVRHPLYRFIWKPDIDCIPNDEMFSLAMDHIRSKSNLGLLPDASRDILMAMDLAVHKDPNADVLFLSSDESLAGQALSEVLRAHTTHQRFRSFYLGQLSSDGQLEVAGLQSQALPFGMDSVSSFVAASPGLKFGLVVVGKGTPRFDHLALYTHPFTRIIDASFSQGGDARGEKLAVTHTFMNKSSSIVQILRPAPRENWRTSHQFDKILLIGRTPAHEDDACLRDCLRAELSLPVDKHELTELRDVTIGDNTLIVSTVELTGEVIARATPEQYSIIQQILAKPVRIVWISGSGLHEDSDPTRAVFHGLARAVMIEMPATEIYSLELYPHNTPAEISRYVTRVITRPEGSPPDYEFLQSDSGLLVSRGVPDEFINSGFRIKDQRTAISEPLGSAGPVTLSLSKTGQLSSVQFIKTPTQTLQPNDVLVKIACVGLNAKDVYALAGRVETPQATCSLECTGQILEIGSAVRDLAVYDNVAVLYPGHFGSHEVVPSYSCVKLHPEEDLRSLASVLVVFGTALYALEHRAHLQPGESVLIHSATGGVGIAAIQIAKSMGAEIFATVGTEEKKQHLVEQYGLQPDHILNSRTSDFAAQIRSMTNSRGVDVVLNSLVGELLLESWNCLAEFGRFVEIGKKDISDHARLPMDPFKRGATFTAFDLSSLATSSAPAMQIFFHQLISRVIARVRDGSIRPVYPLKSFTAAELPSAFRHFNNPARMGKVVISFEDPTVMVSVVAERFITRFHPDKSYLLVGCLGGLGRSLSQWMISRGARTLIFLGRSGIKKPAARHLVEDLEQQGAKCIVIQGDVTNADIVEKAVQAAPSPLGGVIHAAMGLHEAIFSEMSYEYWREGTSAKIEGAWNLHNALSKLDRERDLDFFIMTSSITGKLGTATESNYCAANNFLDAFARYRRTMGRPAIALGLGAIAEVGYLHEHPEIEDILSRRGTRFLTERDLMLIFDLVLSGAPTSAHSADMVTQTLLLSGVEMSTLRSFHQQGYETSWHSLKDIRWSVLTSALERSSGAESEGKGNTHESALRSAVARKDETLVIAAVQESITQKLSNMVLIPVDKIKIQASLADFAMDSMLASEMRLHIFSMAKVDISFLAIMDPQTTVAALCAMIASSLLRQGIK